MKKIRDVGMVAIFLGLIMVFMIGFRQEETLEFQEAHAIDQYLEAFQTDTQQQTDMEQEFNTQSSEQTADTVDFSPIETGDTGEIVANIQQSLNNHGANLNEDGIFGSATYRAVMNFQQSNSIPANGSVGPNTAAALSGETNTTEDSQDTVN